MPTIKLLRGEDCFVSAEDLPIVSLRIWHRDASGYAVSGKKENGTYHTTYMHRLVTNAPEGSSVDHADGNRLNNQRTNLRICTQGQNSMNSGPTRRSVSGIRGVYRNSHGRPWRAQIHDGAHIVHLGTFNTTHEARAAYVAAARRIYGDFVRDEKAA